MYSRISPDHPLRKLFGGLVEQVFMTELGICNPKVTDYVASLLVEFVHIDAIYRMRTVDGRAIRELSAMEAGAHLGPQADETTRNRVVHQYIGDFTLFWAGVYPEQLRAGRRADRLGEYLSAGRRGYGIASELAPPDGEPPPAVLRQLSDEFEECVHALSRVRHGWESRGVN